MSKNARPANDNDAAIRAALAADPGATASALAFAAGMSVSTARAILGRMEADGTATRTTDASKPTGPHRWTLATTTPAAARGGRKKTATTPAATRASGPRRGRNRTAAADTATGDSDAAPVEKLPPGGLRGMVEDFLLDHPGEEFSPTAVKNALDKIHAPRTLSSGAINNALEKLTLDGVAVRTCDAPKKWALADDADA